jgi:hypothetical protein
VKVRVIDSDDLDYEEFTNLQREAFAELLAKSGASDAFLQPEFFRWKYNPPAGRARIALAYDESGLIASNAMFPLRVRHADSTVLAWQSCDTATAPRGRGKGCFSDCIGSLAESLGEDEIFYGFPNASSMRGCMNVGWRVMSPVTTWVNPISLFGVSRLAGVDSIDAFPAGCDALSKSAGGDALAYVDRSADYLNWRYCERPGREYTRFVQREGDDVLGLIVVRRAQALNRNVALVMDLLGRNRKIERALLRRASGWAVEQGTRMVVHMDTNLSLLDGGRAAFSPVPSMLLPKKQLLMGAALRGGEHATSALGCRWRVQMGDWDAF